MAFEVASVKLAKPGTFTMPTFFLPAMDGQPRGRSFLGKLATGPFDSGLLENKWELFQDVRAQLPNPAIEPLCD